MPNPKPNNIIDNIITPGKSLKRIVAYIDDNYRNVNFVKRLVNPNRKYILDWENKNYIATHKLSYATDNNEAIVFPMVLEVNGKLIDYTNPKYKIDWRQALQLAINNNNVIYMPEEDAKLFTTTYKSQYSKF